MQLNLGTKIRELRHRDGRTQDALADALGVTAQAVSRWESGGSYPDMEIIPAIANYFHITIDELFGYSVDREEKIKDITDKADAVLKKQGRIFYGTATEDVSECIDMLRLASDEFPNEPRILLKLAQVLNMWGYCKYQARGHIDDSSGIIEEDTEYNSQNVYWHESLRAYERLLKADPSPEDRETAICQLTPLYCRMGEYEKAKALVNDQNTIVICKEMLLPSATFGEEKARYQGERIMALLSNLRFAVYQSIGLKPALSESEYKEQVLLSLLNLYETIFTDGKCGVWHWDIGQIYLSLAKSAATRGGNIQNEMEYFDKGFDHYKEYQRILVEGEYTCSAPLVSNIKSTIKENCLPIGEDFWKNELKCYPESFRNEIYKNKKYTECFE